MASQREKVERFRALHARPSAFILANAWDAGSARLLAEAGFEALATTSGGFAFTLGKRDNYAGREAVLRNAAELVAASDLPVSADLEDAFAPTPEGVAETFRLAGAVGLAGGSIEDSTRDPNAPLLPIERAAERVRAAAESAHALPAGFVLTGRAENFIAGRPDLADTIARLQAYQEAGADVLFAPGLTREEDIRAVVRSVDRPVNVIAVPAHALLAGAARRDGRPADQRRQRADPGRVRRDARGGARDARAGTFGFSKTAPPTARFNSVFTR